MYWVFISYSNFEKMHGSRLRWYWYVQRIRTNAVARRVESTTVDEKRIHGKPKLTTDDQIKNNMCELNHSEDFTRDKTN